MQQTGHAEHVARRAFIKKAAISAALAVPAIESLTKSDILVKSALASTVQTWTVTATYSPPNGGTVMPLTQQVANGADALGIVIFPAGPVYSIVTITDNGNPVTVTNPAGMTYAITNVTQNHAVVVHFGAG